MNRRVQGANVRSQFFRLSTNTAALNENEAKPWKLELHLPPRNVFRALVFLVISGLIHCVQGEMLFVEQRTGDSLRLPCDVIPPAGDSVAVILWYRDNAPTAIYTYDARNESLGFQQHTPRGPDLASRASFYPKPPAALTITGALPEDSGIYQCRVDFTHAPSRTTRIQAIVITEIKDIELVRASPPIGRENHPFRDRSVEASLHQPLRLLCRTVGGDPQPKIWWTINDYIIPTRRKYSTSKQKPAMMSLKPFNVRSSVTTINISNRQMSRNSIRHSNKPIEKETKEKSYHGNYLLETGIFHAMQRLELSSDQPFGDVHSTLDVNLYNNASVSTLKISNVTMAFEGATLSCWAANSNLSTPLQVKMELDIFSPPSSAELAGFPEAFVSGEPHPLSCRVYGSRPRPKLEWSLSKPEGPAMKLSSQDLSDPNFWSHIHDSGRSTSSQGPSRGSYSTATQTLQPNGGQRLSSSADRALLRKQSYISGQLKVVLGKEDHGGQLSCVAWNKFFPSSRVNDTRTVLVNYAPEVELELGVQIDPAQVREGSDLYFTCSVDSRPPADLLTWTHKNRTLKNDPSEGVLMSGEHLVLQTVTRNWTGAFSCTAANSIASVVSNTIDITILYAPVCSNQAKKLYQVQLGEFVSLACSVDSKPPEVQFEWTFATNISKELVSQEWVRTSGRQSWLRYRPEKIHDYGTIRCFAINAIGRQKMPCEYSVEPAPAPTPPTLNCSVTNQSWHSLNVQCHLSRENSTAAESPRVALDSQEIKERKELEQLLEEWETRYTSSHHADASPTLQDASTSFTLTVESLNSQQVLYNATNNIGTFSVSGLTAGVDYSLNIAAMTPLGPTEPLLLTALTLRAAENRINLNGNKGRGYQSQLLDGTTLLAISIGCIMALFLCVIPTIAIVVCRKARRRGRELRSNSQNTITHEVEDQDLKIKATGSEAPDLITDETTSRDNLLTVSKLGPRIPNPKRQGCPGCISTQKDPSLGFCSRPEHNCGLHHAAQRTLISSHSLKPAGSQDSAGLTMEIYNPMEAISERCLQETPGMDYSAYDRPLDPMKQSATPRYCESSTSGYGDTSKRVDLTCHDSRAATSSQYNINVVHNDTDHNSQAACNQLLGYSNRFFTLPHKTPTNPTNFSGKSRNLRTVQEAQDTGSKLLLETTYAGRSTESLCSPGSESRV